MMRYACFLVREFAGDIGGVAPPNFALISSSIALAIITGIAAFVVSGAPNYDDVNAAMNRA